MNGKIWLRILAGVVLIAAIAGIAFFAYQAGVVHGSPITIQASNGQSQTVPAYPYDMPFGYGWRGGWYGPFPFFGFGCFAPLIALFLLFLAFRAFRFMLWGPRWGWGWRGHMHGRHGWDENGVPPMFREMHDRAHGKTETDNKE